MHEHVEFVGVVVATGLIVSFITILVFWRMPFWQNNRLQTTRRHTACRLAERAYKDLVDRSLDCTTLSSLLFWSFANRPNRAITAPPDQMMCKATEERIEHPRMIKLLRGKPSLCQVRRGLTVLVKALRTSFTFAPTSSNGLSGGRRRKRSRPRQEKQNTGGHFDSKCCKSWAPTTSHRSAIHHARRPGQSNCKVRAGNIRGAGKT